MYLHVEKKNIAAQELYSKMIYTLVLGGVSSIAYNIRLLSRRLHRYGRWEGRHLVLRQWV
jgi:hypothetical protein